MPQQRNVAGLSPKGLPDPGPALRPARERSCDAGAMTGHEVEHGAAGAAGLVRGFVAAGNTDAALRAVLQLAADLERADPDLRAALCATPPPLTEDARFDALLAAVVEDALTAAALPLPAWLSEGARRLDERWDVEPVPSLRAAARGRTLEAFRRRGVFLDPAELRNG